VSYPYSTPASPSPHQRRAAVGRKASEMVIDYFLRTEFAGLDVEQLVERTGFSRHIAESMLEMKNLMFQDVLQACEATGIDIGLTIRLQDGREVTFFPSQNFGIGAAPREGRPAKAEEQKETK